MNEVPNIINGRNTFKPYIPWFAHVIDLLRSVLNTITVDKIEESLASLAEEENKVCKYYVLKISHKKI